MAEAYRNPYKYERKNRNKWLIGALAMIIVMAAAAGLFFIQKQKSASPVPSNVQKAVNFAIYYPEQKKLPNGYTFNPSSISKPVDNGVTYAVSYGGTKKIVFSIQPKPTDSELQSFYSQYIPLKNDSQTHLGQAEIGVYHDQTLVSLPIINGPWIIVTAPKDVNQDQLKQVLQSLKT